MPLMRRDGVLEIEVRITLETDDKQQIYMTSATKISVAMVQPSTMLTAVTDAGCGCDPDPEMSPTITPPIAITNAMLSNETHSVHTSERAALMRMPPGLARSRR